MGKSTITILAFLDRKGHVMPDGSFADEEGPIEMWHAKTMTQCPDPATCYVDVHLKHRVGPRLRHRTSKALHPIVPVRSGRKMRCQACKRTVIEAPVGPKVSLPGF